VQPRQPLSTGVSGDGLCKLFAHQNSITFLLAPYHHIGYLGLLQDTSIHHSIISLSISSAPTCPQASFWNLFQLDLLHLSTAISVVLCVDFFLVLRAENPAISELTQQNYAIPQTRYRTFMFCTLLCYYTFTQVLPTNLQVLTVTLPVPFLFYTYISSICWTPRYCS
jgi:hypothetical protein